MTPEQQVLLAGVAIHFHQDFDLEPDGSARVLFAAYAHALSEAERTAFNTTLEALLAEHPDQNSFSEAFWNAGAGCAPNRADVEDFLAWAMTSDGRHEIETINFFLAS